MVRNDPALAMRETQTWQVTVSDPTASQLRMSTFTASQIFVTLSRTPHLDGAYARVGSAEGDWDALVEGDVIEDASVED